MTNPAITLERGVGWTSQGWRAHNAHFKSVARMAHAGIMELGVTYELPKRGRVRRFSASARFHEDALAFSAVKFRLHTVRPISGRLSNLMNPKETASYVVHEVIHCVRMEHFQLWGTREEVASEGLACMGEFTYATEHGLLPEQGLSYADLELNTGLLSDYKNVLNYSGKAAKWQGAYSTAGQPMPNLALLGVQLVARRVDQGYSLNDLLQVTARQVLGL